MPPSRPMRPGIDESARRSPAVGEVSRLLRRARPVFLPLPLLPATSAPRRLWRDALDS